VKIHETAIAGCYVIELEPIADHRGFFARSFDYVTFNELGANPRVEQCNISFNRAAYTLRGLHYQTPPHEEAKLVRCVRGTIFDVVVDLRTASATFLTWLGFELSADNRRSVLVPEECAHGYLTLEEATEIHYQVSSAYSREASRGLRWNDPTLAIDWPHEPLVVSRQDSAWPFLGQ
jgi:dTDP-4-dehydrorhamnose 3,5-epimerase